MSLDHHRGLLSRIQNSDSVLSIAFSACCHHVMSLDQPGWVQAKWCHLSMSHDSKDVIKGRSVESFNSFNPKHLCVNRTKWESSSQQFYTYFGPELNHNAMSSDHHLRTLSLANINLLSISYHIPFTGTVITNESLPRHVLNDFSCDGIFLLQFFYADHFARFQVHRTSSVPTKVNYRIYAMLRLWRMPYFCPCHWKTNILRTTYYRKLR